MCVCVCVCVVNSHDELMGMYLLNVSAIKKGHLREVICPCIVIIVNMCSSAEIINSIRVRISSLKLSTGALSKKTYQKMLVS